MATEERYVGHLNRRYSTKEKYANDKQWFKDRADSLIKFYYSDMGDEINGVSKQRRLKVNYDLTNGIFDANELSYVCQAYGKEAGELPARMTNHDILSSKVKVVLGKEQAKGLNMKVVAVNPEATTRKEQEFFNRVKDFAINYVMQPVRLELEAKEKEAEKGKQLSPEERQQLKVELEQQEKAQTPEEVKQYMTREHQDPAEVLGNHLLNFLQQKLNLKVKFDEGFSHLVKAAYEIFYVGEFNGEPDVFVVNPMRFSCDIPPDSQFIEDCDSASCEYRMPLYQVLSKFGKNLTEEEIDTLHTELESPWQHDDYLWTNNTLDEYVSLNGTISVVHTVWKSLREFQFLYRLDENGEETVSLVNEEYELSPENGDIRIETEWLVEAYETWRLGNKVYTNMRAIPGQFRDMDNLYDCKLPYYGAVIDSQNSQATSLVDRLKVFQYYYNIIWYRLELLLASDVGQKFIMDVKLIPDSYEGNFARWWGDFQANPVMFVNMAQEGNSLNDLSTSTKSLNLSLISDIKKYIELADYINQEAGASVGITKPVEGQTKTSDSVGNVQQNLIQTGFILESYYALHAQVKKNVQKALLECAKVTYGKSKPKKLSYFLDEVDVMMFDLDPILLDNTTFGLFIMDSSKTETTIENLRQLAHAALQNQQIVLSDIAAILRQDNIVDIEGVLKVAEERRREEITQAQKQQQEAQSKEADKNRAFVREEHEMEKEKIILKEEERRKTEIQKASLLGMSFNPDVDTDGDGENDFLEIAKYGLDAEIKKSKTELERDKFEYQKASDKEKMTLEREKLKFANKKSAQK